MSTWVIVAPSKLEIVKISSFGLEWVLDISGDFRKPIS